MKVFNSVSDLALASLTADQLCEVKEVGRYRIKASGSGIGLANSNIAVPVASGTSVNVLQWGADPTGVADSTAAIQAAIDSLTADKNSVVRFPAGRYLISSTISITASSVSIVGVENGFRQSGAIEGSVVIDWTGGASAMFTCNKNLINVIARSGNTATEGGLEN